MTPQEVTDMADFFNEILNMSITASWLILAVMLMRLIFSKAPKWIRCAMWGMVGLRLILPFSLESALSLIPSAQTIPPALIHTDTAESLGTAEILSYVGNNSVSYELGIQDGSLIFSEICAPDCDTVNPLLLNLTVASVLWIIGLAALLIYACISYVKLRSKVATAVLLRDNIYQSEAVFSPFILGIINPKIYIPFGLSDKTLQYVESHENAHLRRCDHITKPLAFLILCLHWFNPLVWISYSLFCKDIELACDEKVIREMNLNERKSYATAILDCGISRRRIAACPLAFGETSIKERVRNALSYKKPMLWVILFAVIACIALGVGFMTNPDKKSESPTLTPTDYGSSIVGVKMTVTDINLDGDRPTITVLWSNSLDNTVLLGEPFEVEYYENGKWESCQKPDTENIFHLPAYILNPNDTKEMVYHVDNYDFSKSGNYRITANYDLDIYVGMSLSRVLSAYAGFSIGEATVPNETNPFPLEPESVTVNNEFVGIQSGSVPCSNVRSEKYMIPDGYDDTPIYAGASNRHKLYYSSILHMPTRAIRSTEELEEYKKMTLGGTDYIEYTMLNEYDDAFFRDNLLIMINTMEQNDRFAYRLIGVYSSGSDVWALIEKTHSKEYKSTDRAYGTNIAIEVRKDYIPNAKTFDAWVEKDILSDESVTTANENKIFYGRVTSVRDDIITVKSEEGEVVHINGTWLGNKSVSIRVENPKDWQVGDRTMVVYTALYETADSTVIGIEDIIKTN